MEARVGNAIERAEGGERMPPAQGRAVARAEQPDVVKLTVNLPAADVQTLRSIASHRGITLTAALRRAIEMERFIEEITARGGTLLIEEPDRSIRQVVIR